MLEIGVSVRLKGDRARDRRRVVTVRDVGGDGGGGEGGGGEGGSGDATGATVSPSLAHDGGMLCYARVSRMSSDDGLGRELVRVGRHGLWGNCSSTSECEHRSPKRKHFCEPHPPKNLL